MVQIWLNKLFDLYRLVIVFNILLGEEDIKDFLIYLGTVHHKIFEKELISYIKFIHFSALQCIISKFEEKKIINWNFPISNNNHGIFEQKELLPFIFQAVYSVTTNMNFEMKKDLKNQDNYENKTLLLIDFVDIYVQNYRILFFILHVLHALWKAINLLRSGDIMLIHTKEFV